MVPVALRGDRRVSLRGYFPFLTARLLAVRTACVCAQRWVHCVGFALSVKSGRELCIIVLLHDIVLYLLVSVFQAYNNRTMNMCL